MSQPTTHPHDVANLLVPALSSVVGALADRGGKSIPEYDARAQETWTLIQSFRPRDSMDLMLVGQFLALHEALADGTRDLLRDMTDSMKPRSRSGLVAIGRVCLAYADRIEKRGMDPYRTEIAALAPKQAAVAGTQAPHLAAVAAAVQPKAAPPDRTVPAASSAASSQAPTPDPDPHLAAEEASAEPNQTTDATPAGEPASWLDEPHQEWVIETPAALAARASVALQALAAAKTVPPEVVAPDKPAAKVLGAKCWYVAVGAPSMESIEAKAFPPLPRDAVKRERKSSAGGD